MDTCDESHFKCICKDGDTGAYCEKEQGCLIRLQKSSIMALAVLKWVHLPPNPMALLSAKII